MRTFSKLTDNELTSLQNIYAQICVRLKLVSEGSEAPESFKNQLIGLNKEADRRAKISKNQN